MFVFQSKWFKSICLLGWRLITNFVISPNALTDGKASLKSLTRLEIRSLWQEGKTLTYMPQFFFTNVYRPPSSMVSASSKHSLHVLIENNAEEVDIYEVSRDLSQKPRYFYMSLHNPKEPADMRSSSLKVPFGYSTTFLITPTARKIDDSGKQLTEFQRDCRLDEDTDELDIFNIYTRSACLFECKMKHSFRRCGCIPWDYPLHINEKVI